MYICLLFYLQPLLIKGSPTIHIHFSREASNNKEPINQRHTRSPVISNDLQYHSEDNIFKNIPLNSQTDNNSNVPRDSKSRSSETKDDYLDDLNNLFEELLESPEEPNRIARSLMDDASNDGIDQDGIQVGANQSVPLKDINQDKSLSDESMNENNRDLMESKLDYMDDQYMARTEGNTHAQASRDSEKITQFNDLESSDRNNAADKLR